MSPFDRAHMTSYSTLIETIRLSCTVFEIASYLSKVADFDPPHLHLASQQGVTPVEFRGDLWHKKSKFPGLSCGVVCVILRLAVLVEHRLVTDTDGRTWTYRPVASTADAQHRAVKTSRCRIFKFWHIISSFYGVWVIQLEGKNDQDIKVIKWDSYFVVVLPSFQQESGRLDKKRHIEVMCNIY